MQKIIAANGDTYDIAWIGIANLDGGLRFGVIGGELSEILQTFTDPKNCTVITRTFDGDPFSYKGYTVFRGVTINYDGTIVVSLSKI